MQAASQSPTAAPAACVQVNKQPRPPNQCSTEPTLRASPHPTAAPTHRWQRGKGARGKMLASSWSNVAVQCAVAVQTLGAGSDWRVHAAARVSLACLHARRSVKGDGHLRSRRARKQQRPTTHNQRKPTHRRRTWLASRDPSCVRPVCAVVLVSWCWCAQRRREARGRQRRGWLRTAPVAVRPVARPSVRRWCRDDPQS